MLSVAKSVRVFASALGGTSLALVEADDKFWFQERKGKRVLWESPRLVDPWGDKWNIRMTYIMRDMLTMSPVARVRVLKQMEMLYAHNA